MVRFRDDFESESHVVHNNFDGAIGTSRRHVERIEGMLPDSVDMMRMGNLADATTRISAWVTNSSTESPIHRPGAPDRGAMEVFDSLE